MPLGEVMYFMRAGFAFAIWMAWFSIRSYVSTGLCSAFVERRRVRWFYLGTGVSAAPFLRVYTRQPSTFLRDILLVSLVVYPAIQGAV